jgi:hypothetical protein
MIAEVSLPCSKQPASGPTPQPNYFFKMNFTVKLKSTSTFFKWTSSFRFFDQKFVSCFDYLNNIWRKMECIKILIMQLSLAFYRILPLRFKYCDRICDKVQQTGKTFNSEIR